MKRMHIQKFLEKHNILHAERVEFTLTGYTVWSYRRDDKGEYVVNQGQPIMDTQFVPYEDAGKPPW